MIRLLACCFLVVLCSSTAPYDRETRHTHIVYDISEAQIALRLPINPPTVLTFDPSAKMSDLLQHLKGKHLRDECVLSTSDSVALNVDSKATLLSEALTLADGLLCSKQRFKVIAVPAKYKSNNHHKGMRLITEKNLKDPAFIYKVLKAMKKHHLLKRETLQPYPLTKAILNGDGLFEAIYWAWDFITHHFGPLHPFNTYENTGLTGLYDLNTGTPLSHTGEKVTVAGRDADKPVTMALAADWGSGVQESDFVSQLMVKDFTADYTIHIGDVYLHGTPEQMQSNVFGVAPQGVAKGVTWPNGQLGTFALNGNHEAFGRFLGYFDHWLPAIGVRDANTKQFIGQKASYFALENEYWRVVAIDTGYSTYGFIQTSKDNEPQAVLDWLTNVVKINDDTDKRGIIIMSHHQYKSAFDTGFMRQTPDEMEAILPTNRQILWLFGHEHKQSWYDDQPQGNVTIKSYSRCMGNGGFPTTLDPLPPGARAYGLLAYDDRYYETFSGGLFGSNETEGYNGWGRVTFNGPQLTITYSSLTDNDGVLSDSQSAELVQETFGVDSATGNVVLQKFQVINPNITIVDNVPLQRQ